MPAAKTRMEECHALNRNEAGLVLLCGGVRCVRLKFIVRVRYWTDVAALNRRIRVQGRNSERHQPTAAHASIDYYAATATLDNSGAARRCARVNHDTRESFK